MDLWSKGHASRPTIVQLDSSNTLTAIPFPGRLGNDPAEEDAIRAALREATAARSMALVVNSAHASCGRDGRRFNADAYVPSRPSAQTYGSLCDTVVATACPDLTRDSSSRLPLQSPQMLGVHTTVGRQSR